MVKIRESPPGERPTADQFSAAAPIEDFSDLIDGLTWCFLNLSRLTGEEWGWNHPRLVNYLRRCGVRNRYWLPRSRYEFLIEEMNKLIEELEKNGNHCQ